MKYECRTEFCPLLQPQSVLTFKLFNFYLHQMNEGVRLQSRNCGAASVGYHIADSRWRRVKALNVSFRNSLRWTAISSAQLLKPDLFNHFSLKNCYLKLHSKIEALWACEPLSWAQAWVTIHLYYLNRQTYDSFCLEHIFKVNSRSSLNIWIKRVSFLRNFGAASVGV